MRILFFTLSVFLISGCGKDKSYNKKLDGSWSIVSLKITEPSGIGEYVNGSGTFTFDSKKGSKDGTYDFDISCDYNNSVFPIIETGTYVISNQLMNFTNPQGETNKADINYINKSDLEFVIPNWDNKNIYLIMKKIE